MFIRKANNIYSCDYLDTVAFNGTSIVNLNLSNVNHDFRIMSVFWDYQIYNADTWEVIPASNNPVLLSRCLLGQDTLPTPKIARTIDYVSGGTGPIFSPGNCIALYNPIQVRFTNSFIVTDNLPVTITFANSDEAKTYTFRTTLIIEIENVL